MQDFEPQPASSEPAPARLVVDLDALAANYRALRRLAPEANVAAVVKANAYGLGVHAVAPVLAGEGCDKYFVATVGEALELRGVLPGACIYTLGGVPAGSADALASAAIRPVLNTGDDVRHWLAAAPGRPCALQIDTGLTRCGFGGGELAALCAMPGLVARLGLSLLLTHYACADEPGSPHNEQQRIEFERLRSMLPALPTSLANSAALWLGRAYAGDVVRPGIALYGGRPAAAGANPMREVVRFEARVVQVRELDAPADVGYGATAHVPAGTRVAIVAAGYADGYPRALSGGVGHVLVGGALAPVLGRVSMDLVTVDVTALGRGTPSVGDYVTLFGGGLPLEDVADAAGTLGYELLTGLGSRVRRVYVGGGAS